VSSSVGDLSPPTRGRLGAVSTARLDLTPIDQSSVDALAPIFAKREVWEYPFGRGFAHDETVQFVEGQVKHWEAFGYGLWQATIRSECRPIGYLGLAVPTFLPDVLPAVEVGWRIDPDVWGMGYATEGAAAALAGAFNDLGLDEVLSLPQVDNPRSVRVAERLGMRWDCTATLPATERRGSVEVAVMVVTHAEWEQTASEHGT
jgi:RimJ/RimL family protein N-acetyltransferase